MQINVYKNAFSTKFIFLDNNFSFLPSYINKISIGAFYDSEGFRINLSQRIGGIGGDKVIDMSPSFFMKKCIAEKFLYGKSIYLGPFMKHYGHFITETLSRMWLLDFSKYDNIIFSPFIFGSFFYEFHKEIFDIFNIELNNIFILDKEISYEELYVPEQLWFINNKPDVRLNSVYEYIKKRFYKPLNINRKVFLSDKNFKRLENLKEIEKLFLDKGFNIIYPADLTFKEQINIYLNANIIVSLSGTLSHNVLFTKKDKCKFIELGDIRTKNKLLPMQKFAYDLSQVDYYFIPFIGKDGNYDLQYLNNKIKEIL